MLKLCKDCVYFEPDLTCHYKQTKTNSVTGKKHYSSCNNERTEPWPWPFLLNQCGKRGRWWVKAYSGEAID